MFIATVKSGPAEVIASGTVIAFDNQPIEITVTLPDYTFIWLLNFIDEDGKDELRTDNRVIDENTLEMTFYNFKNPLGSGSISPLKIGTYNNKSLFIHYRIYDLNTSDKTIHYTIFLNKEEIK